MNVPPPLPRQRISAFVLIAIPLLLLALAARAILGGFGHLLTEPLQKLTVALGGIVAAGVAAILGIVALFLRRRPWVLSMVLVVAAICLGKLLTGELRQPIEGVTSRLRESAAQGFVLGKEPIPQEKGASTGAQLQPSMVAWGEEAMVRPYLEHGHHDPAWDDAAQQFIRGVALEVTDYSVSPGEEHLRALGRQLQHAGCNDPWVLFLIRRLGEKDPDFAEAMAKASSSLASAGYPPFCLWWARAETVRGLRREAPSEAAAVMKDCLEALRGALSAKPLDAGAYCAWSELFSSDAGEKLLEQNGEEVCGVVDSVAGVQEWFRLWLRGHSEVQQAWLARGGGWANSVTEERWKLFSQHLAAARAALEQAQKLEPDQPAIATTMMTVELGCSRPEEMRQQFDRAIQARFDYLPAYGSMRNGLLPRWFGSTEAQLAFGRACLATGRFDTEVPCQMLQVVYDIAKDQKDPEQYYKTGAPWEDLMKTLDGYLAHGNPARRSYYLSEKAVFASKRGMDELVGQLLKELDYKVDPEVVAGWNLPVDWAERIASLSGPAGKLVLEADHEDHMNLGRSLASLLAAQKLPDLPPVVQGYIAQRIADVQALTALDSAPWLPWAPPQDQSGWKVEGGNWQISSSALLELKTGNAGSFLTRLRPVGDTWDIRGELFLKNQGPGRVEAAFFCGPPDNREGRGLSLRFWSNVNGWAGASVARGFENEAMSKQRDLAESFPIYIRMINHRIGVMADNGVWFANQPIPEGTEIDKNSVLTIGSTAGAGKTVEFRRVLCRSLIKAN